MSETSKQPLVNPVIRLDLRDNVVVARTEIAEGTQITSENLVTNGLVPTGHKIAATLIPQGEPILKYNTVIGFAAEDLQPGTPLHKHNIEFKSFVRDYAFCRDYKEPELLPVEEQATFQGIVRADGRVATRNYIGVLALSNCAATVVHRISDFFTPERLAQFPNVDGVVPFSHEKGCGGDSTAEHMEQLRRTLAGYCRHPNIAAMIVVGLGCERNDLQGFLDQTKLVPGEDIETLIMQELGGSRKTIDAGVELVKQKLPTANAVKREPVSASHLMVGLQCGGSDGFSGVTANPALGHAMDLLVKNGGTAILSETTELFGVEHTLTCRARTREIGERIVERIEWWLDQCQGRNTQIMGKVSPGNDAGGLANVYEKSLGGVKKGGTTSVMDAYYYAEPVTEHGLVFMDTPGYDPTAATGQIAGGANMIAFTTGRGSCFGSVPAPSVKLATNTPMYQRMEDDMDINCGVILEGKVTIEEMGEQIFRQLLEIASGEPSKSEEIGVGKVEFVPWNLLIMG